MTCTYCEDRIDIEYRDIDGDVYCSAECRRDHLLHSISRALFLIAGKECCE